LQTVFPEGDRLCTLALLIVKMKRDVMSLEILSDPEENFPVYYNRSTFMFRHGLSGHPLLQLPSLIDLADRLEKYDGCYWSNGSAKVTDRWEKGVDRRQSLRKTLENIAENDSLVILKFVVHDAIAGPFFCDILKTIILLAGPEMAEDVLVGRANILIASPRRITAFHIDSDVNYLLQVAGDKTFAVFDQNDRKLVTDEERELYFNGDESAASFKPDRQNECTNYDLRPGFGVHVPCMAPHWARNREQVSIAVSCCFDLASIQRLGLVYKTNHRLRSLGIKPRSPRDETWSNGAKLLGARTAVAIGALLRPQAAPQREMSGWTPV
jgi:hypothetical protein